MATVELGYLDGNGYVVKENVEITDESDPETIEIFDGFGHFRFSRKLIVSPKRLAKRSSAGNESDRPPPG